MFKKNSKNHPMYNNIFLKSGMAFAIMFKKETIDLITYVYAY